MLPYSYRSRRFGPEQWLLVLVLPLLLLPAIARLCLDGMALPWYGLAVCGIALARFCRAPGNTIGQRAAYVEADEDSPGDWKLRD